MKTKPAWSARCDCYCGHNSSSGRCTARSSQNAEGKYIKGVLDPTHHEHQMAVCKDCRANCPCHKGDRITNRITNNPTGEQIMSKEINIRANAFGRVENLRVMVAPVEVMPLTRATVRGLIRVWDSVAGHYTLCHSLSQSAVRRIHAIAESAR